MINNCSLETQKRLIPLVDSKCSLDSIYKLEKFFKSMPGADTSGGDYKHHFSDGLCARELTLPKDTFIIGEMHLKGNINFLMKGTIAVSTDDGLKIMHAPEIVVSGPGTKRVGYAMTETVWVTVSATTGTTEQEVRDEIIATGPSDPRLEGILCLGEQ